MKAKSGSSTLSYLLVLLITLFLCEITVRVFFALTQGSDILYYGLNSSKIQAKSAKEKPKFEFGADIHDVKIGKYSKYQAGTRRTMLHKRSGEVIEVQINNQGFRGPDFEMGKPANTFRVVTLGASSTFGYYVADNETYPAQLQQELDRGCPGKSYQVINLGVPHLRSEQIVSLFELEGLALSPDLVTFYEGINDTMGPLVAKPVESVRSLVTKSQFVYDVYRSIRSISLLVKLVDFASRNANYEAFSQQQVEAYTGDSKARVFMQNVSRIHRLCRKQGCEFMPITQQSQSKTFDEAQRRTVSYEQEVRMISDKLRSGEKINENQLFFLTHSEFMKRLRTWASENRVSLVEGIQALDQSRDSLLTWVHLDSAGNTILAKTLAKRILELSCGE